MRSAPAARPQKKRAGQQLKWWDKKQQQIAEQLGAAKQHPVEVVRQYETAIENHTRYAKWLRRHGEDLDWSEESESMVEWLTAALASNALPQLVRSVLTAGITKRKSLGAILHPLGGTSR